MKLLKLTNFDPPHSCKSISIFYVKFNVFGHLHFLITTEIKTDSKISILRYWEILSHLCFFMLVAVTIAYVYTKRSFCCWPAC